MKKYKDLFIALLSFLLYFIFSVIFSYIYYFSYKKLHNSSSILFNIILIVYDIIPILVLFLLHKNSIINDFKSFISNKGKWFLKYILLFLGSVLLMGLLNYIISKITNMDTSENERTVRELIKLIPIYMSFSTVIYAPFVEELLFRKCIRDIVKGNDKYIKITYILISAIVFGLMHVLTLDASFNDILMGIPYMVVGLAFAYIYVKTDNIFSTIQFHLIHNTLLLIIQFIIM